MRLTLLSSSRVTRNGQPSLWLDWAEQPLRATLGDVPRVLFVPFAGVTTSHTDYAQQARQRFSGWGYAVERLHGESPARATEQLIAAKAVAVGGGNTFALLARLQALGLVKALARRVRDGMPFVGWSAGSNIAGPSICTTNDMPIVQPTSFDALGLCPVQINPHFTDAQPPGHHGETRTQRLTEYAVLNPDRPVIGLPEGTWLRCDDGEWRYHGHSPASFFRDGQVSELVDGDRLP